MVESVESSTYDLDRRKRLFTEAREHLDSARREASKARRYYDGKQRDPKVKLRGGEPPAMVNEVRPAVEGMVGVVDRGKSDPRAYPRTPQDENAAEVATDSLRYVSDRNRWHNKKIEGFRGELIEGVTAAIIEVEQNLEPVIRLIPASEFFYDPHSRALDFSDAAYMGVAKWQYLDALEQRYPDHALSLREQVGNGDTGDLWWKDRPDDRQASWVDAKRRRLLVVELYERRAGSWLKCVYTGALTLEEGPSPYLLSDDGAEPKPFRPIEANSAYVDEDNIRYGVVRDMFYPQDEINKRRGKAMHFSSMRQVQETGPDSGAMDSELARKEAARPDGVIPVGWQIVPTTDLWSGNMALLQEAKGEIRRVAPNPAITGRENAPSGRAQLVSQQAGLTELSHLFTGLEDWEQRIMRQVWARIRQFWTEPKFVRVTDEEEAFRFVQINEPVMGEPEPVIDPTTGLPAYDPITREIVMQPRVVGMKNAVSQMDVDIIIDSTPDTANVQAEQFQALIDLKKAGEPIPLGAIIKASSLPKKRELLDEIKAQQEGQQQQPDPRQDAAFQAELENKNADTMQKRATAQQRMVQAQVQGAQALAPQPMPVQPAGPPPGF